MHIPDGYLGPETAAAGWAAVAPFWYVAGRKIRQIVSQPRAIPVLAASAAFSFLVMMLNLPVLGGTTAHAVGATLIAVIAGPWVAVLAITAALVIQALLFADGGLLAIGINCLNMAVVMPFVGYGLFKLIAGTSPLRSWRRVVGAGVGAYASAVAGSLMVGLELGIQPLLHTVDGLAQYAPYGLKTAIPAMVVSHLLIAGPVEAGFTMAVFAFLARTQPSLFDTRSDAPRTRYGWLWGLVALLVALVPLGLLATGTAWGEWGSDEIKTRVGYVPAGLERWGEKWKGVIPDYALPGAEHGAGMVGVYVASAIIGVAVLTAIAWLTVRAYRARNTRV